MWYKDRSRRLNAEVRARHLRSPWLPSSAQRCIGRVGPRANTYSWDPKYGFIAPTLEPVRNPRLTVHCEYPDTPLQPTIEVTFSLSSSYGILTARDAHGWFRRMMREHEQFEVETDDVGALPLSVFSENVRLLVVE